VHHALEMSFYFMSMKLSCNKVPNHLRDAAFVSVCRCLLSYLRLSVQIQLSGV